MGGAKSINQAELNFLQLASQRNTHLQHHFRHLLDHNSMSSDTRIENYYAYDASHVLPAVFAGIVGLSLLIHIWQNL